MINDVIVMIYHGKNNVSGTCTSGGEPGYVQAVVYDLYEYLHHPVDCYLVNWFANYQPNSYVNFVAKQTGATELHFC